MLLFLPGGVGSVGSRICSARPEAQEQQSSRVCVYEHWEETGLTAQTTISKTSVTSNGSNMYIVKTKAPKSA